MKRYLVHLLLVMFSSTSYAQYHYVPIPTSAAIWKCYNMTTYMGGHASPGGTTCLWTQHRFTGKDTTINSDTYFQIETSLMSRDSKEITGSCLDNAFSAPGTAGYMHKIWMIEKRQKLYLLDSLPLDTQVNIPHLDFSAKAVGDSCIDRFHRNKVLYIDTIHINGQLRRRIVTYYRIFSPATDTLIEGIGSQRVGLGFYEMGIMQGYNTAARLICFTVNNQAEYVYNNSACADIWPQDIEDKTKDNGRLKVSPDPVYDQLTIDGIQDADITVCSLTGVVIYTGHTRGRLIIDTSFWPVGVYIVTENRDDSRRSCKVVKY